MNGDHRQVEGLHACGSRRQRIVARPGLVRHRIDEVLKEEAVSLRTAAARMGVDTRQARQEADPACDLTLTALYRWQAALKVPIADLLIPPMPTLSPAIQLRTRLLKAMRTVRSLQLHVEDEDVQLLANGLAQQLMEMMPELANITSWPVCGTRRSLDEPGAIAERQLPDNFFDAAES